MPRFRETGVCARFTSGSRAERGAESLSSQKRDRATREPWVLARKGKRPRRSVGSRGRYDRLQAWRRRPTRWLGDWGAGRIDLFRSRFKAGNSSIGHGLYETRQVSWLQPRARCPKAGG